MISKKVEKTVPLYQCLTNKAVITNPFNPNAYILCEGCKANTPKEIEAKGCVTMRRFIVPMNGMKIRENRFADNPGKIITVKRSADVWCDGYRVPSPINIGPFEGNKDATTFFQKGRESTREETEELLKFWIKAEMVPKDFKMFYTLEEYKEAWERTHE